MEIFSFNYQNNGSRELSNLKSYEEQKYTGQICNMVLNKLFTIMEFFQYHLQRVEERSHSEHIKEN